MTGTASEDAWALIRTVDRGRVFLELCRSGRAVSEDVARCARRLTTLADAEPDGEAAVERCAEAAYQGMRELRPLLLDLLSVHRTALAVGLLDAEVAAEGVPDDLEVELHVAAEGVRSTVDLHRCVEGRTPAFYQALRILRTCSERISAYADRFGTLACSTESGEPMHWHRQRERLHLQ